MSVFNLRSIFILSITVMTLSALSIVQDAYAQAEPVMVEGADASPNPNAISTNDFVKTTNSLQEVMAEIQADNDANKAMAKDMMDKEMMSDEMDQAGMPGAVEESFADEEGEDFFDSDDLVPQGEMSRTGPIKVNPKTHPASKLIIVKKEHEADTKSAQLVSAERAMSLGRYESALLILDGLYEKNKKDSRVLMSRAVTLQKLGRFDEAMNMYENVSKLEPENVDVRVNMLGLLGTRYPSVALRRLLDLHNEHSDSVAVTAQVAVVAAKAGDTDMALRYLGMAASMDPKSASHVFNMAVIADRAGHEEEAISYYEKALEIDAIHGAGRSIPRDSVYERLAEIRS